MKNISLRLALAALLCIAVDATVLLWTPGCGTNAPTKAAQAEQLVIHSVNDGMTEWATFVNAGKAKQSQIDRVKTAYNAYYAAQVTAKAVIEKAIAKDPNTTQADLDTANKAVKDAETSLIGLLNSFLIK